MNEQYLHFTLGPVQSFVAQARRTRDFWAGSFILSWLSGVAMQEVIAQCEESRDKALFPKPEDVVLFPKAEPEFLDWLTGNKKGKNGPAQGSIPNRFKARVSGEFDAENVVKAVNMAWQALAGWVYQHDLENLKLNTEQQERTREIWKRHIEACWEITWAMTDDVTDSAILDQSKNWRSYAPPHEPGVKCMMMDGWQELSGIERPSADGLRAFWETLRSSDAKAIGSDLREREYLCAIAFVKRRFPHYFHKVKDVEMPAGWKLNGWEVGAGRPSVAYMAAVPWLENIIKHANNSDQLNDDMRAFHEAAFDLTKELGEWNSDIKSIRDAMAGRERHGDDKKWRALNGDVFFEAELLNPNKFPSEKKRKQAEKTLAELKGLQRQIQSKAAPFYAVLMMDGDSLGKQMSDESKQVAISEGLQQFTADVPGLVYDYDGFLVYAGGDDVLAVLPMNTALECALAVRECYEEIFASAKHELKLTTSISAAIEFAHIHMPLTKVLRDAHSLLDGVAKERCGRDSLAVRVWKPGGKALEWAMPWGMTCAKDANGKNQLEILRLCESLKGDDPRNQFSNGFFYKIRERLELLNPVNGKGTSVFASGSLDDEDNPAVKLMAAEYAGSVLFQSGVDKQDKDFKQKRLLHAEAVVRPLLKQCRDSVTGFYHADAALLVRFLVHKGVL